MNAKSFLNRCLHHPGWDPFQKFGISYSDFSTGVDSWGGSFYRTNEACMYTPSLFPDLAKRFREDGLLREYGFTDPDRHHVRSGVHYVYRFSYKKLFNAGPDGVGAFISTSVAALDKWLETELSIEARRGDGESRQLELWSRRASAYDDYIIITDVESGLIPRLRADLGVTACMKHALMKWGTDNIRYNSFYCSVSAQKHPKINEMLCPRKPNVLFVDRKTLNVYVLDDGFREYFFLPRDKSHLVKTPSVGDSYDLQAVSVFPSERFVLFSNLITCDGYDESMCFSDLTTTDIHRLIGRFPKPVACVSNLNLSGELEVGGVPIFSNIFRPNGIYTAENCPLCCHLRQGR